MASQDRKTLILDATEALLLEIGNAELTMRKVASRAGISLGNLQYHFSTREDLLLALLLRFLEPYEANLNRRAADGSADLTETLHSLFREVLTHPDFDRYSVIFKEIWAAATHSADIRAALDAYYVRLAAFYRSFLEGAGADALQAERAVLILLPLLEGSCVTRKAIGRPAEDLAAIWAEAFALILGQKG
ncbi:TetR/AcrR family transcriptional regulator [Tropicimonas marinistellae]|uniref:TetR/AcrR family transcriptional regulator n=1 Tax=Tropicimonas marinistellae TaxID=1739787 RepID=UPI00083650E0|nr:TetR/AcrR family transcriptional regulator [Tropicimonas marinistellae]